MKVTFVYPRFEKFLSGVPELQAGLVEYFLGNFTTPPSLGIPILAALTPPEVEIAFIDDNSGERIDYDAPTDLVAINCFTPQATRAFEIADEFRRHGKKVIMGGLFPSFMAEECLKHADSVNIGEGEPTWAKILADCQAGNLQPRYEGGCSTDMAAVPNAQRSIFYRNELYDWDEDLVQVMRGCVYNCPMCPLPAQMGNRIRFRPIERVVDEMRSLKHENVYLADDMLFLPQRQVKAYAREFFEAMAPLGKKFFVNTTMGLSTDLEMLDLAARGGVRNFYCTLNVEPVSIRALQGGARERQALIDLVKAIEDRDIRFFASVAIGRDWDDMGMVDRMLDLLTAANIHTAEFFISTPYPGSPQWERLLRQGRIFDFNWSHYNGAHVVSRPEQMTPDQLREEFIRAWKEFFKLQQSRHAASLEPATWKDGVQVLGKPLQRSATRGQAAVTGMGILSPMGSDTGAITKALRAGKTSIGEVSRVDMKHFRTRLGGEIKNFNPLEWLSEAELKEYEDPYLRYAIVAARRALKDAGIEAGTELRRDVALVLGTCNGGLVSAEAEYSWKHGLSKKPIDEPMNIQAQNYGFGKALSNALKLGGETWVVTTACSSTTVALGLAQMLVNRGYYKTVLVGGSDALCMANMSGFDGLKATSPVLMAPFSMPVGLNIGEAACFWVVEDMEKAMLREARCLGRITGHSTTSDAYHPTTPDPRGRGIARTLANALADSGLKMEEIGCINAHGSGTEANDLAETKGIARFLGDHRMPVTASKSFFGHCMGATGILEASCQLLAMNDDFIPPTLQYTEPRPACVLDCVANQPREVKYDAFISANYAFGGNNAAVVISKWNTPTPARKQLQERVVITGIGTVSPLGLGIDATLAELHRGTVGIGPITRFPLKGRRAGKAGEVAEFKAAQVDRRLDFSALNLISRFAVAAGHFALQQAGLKITPSNSDDAGVVMGVCNGPSEMDHMDSVFTSERRAPNLSSFSNITANSTAGWVSAQLCLKGVSASLSAGPHAGLQSMAYAFDTLAEKRARLILCGAADELYGQTYYNYDDIGYLFEGEEENDYRMRLDTGKRKVLGEGAGMFVMETAESALARGVPIVAEMLGYGMSMDADGFLAPSLKPDGLTHAIGLALSRSGIEATEIGLIVWAPQGNRQDLKVTEACEAVFGARFGEIAMVTTSFNTGFIESASILVSLGAALRTLERGGEFWPQRTGVPELDRRGHGAGSDYVLAVGTSDFGYNFAVVLRKGWEGKS